MKIINTNPRVLKRTVLNSVKQFTSAAPFDVVVDKTNCYFACWWSKNRTQMMWAKMRSAGDTYSMVVGSTQKEVEELDHFIRLNIQWSANWTWNFKMLITSYINQGFIFY